MRTWIVCLFLVPFLLFRSLSHAGTFVCSKAYPPLSYYYDKPNKYDKDIKRIFYKITFDDLVSVYSGRPIFLEDTWLTMVTMSSSYTSTKAAYYEMDLSTDILDKMIKSPYFVDYHVKIAKDEYQLLDLVYNNPPAVGYSTLAPGRYGPLPCFGKPEAGLK